MASAGIKPERKGKCNEDNRKETLKKTAEKGSAKSLRCMEKTSSRRGGWKKREMP